MWSSSCRLPLPQRLSGARPPTTTTGDPLKYACVIGLTPLVTPGPAVSTARPGTRVSLPSASAAKTAVCSCRTSRSRMGGSACTAPSYIGKTCAPESVNIVSMRCAAATATACAPVCASTRPTWSELAGSGLAASSASVIASVMGGSLQTASQRAGHYSGPVPTLNELARAHTDLDDQDLAWLHLLVADWQIIADLSFADLVLWVPDRDERGFWAAAQMRPTMGPTSYVDDLVGAFIPHGRRPLIDLALSQRRVVREGDPEWRDTVPVRIEAIPVRRGDRVLAVIGRNTNLLGVRTPSRLELSYLQTAADLTHMISTGDFPHPGQRSDHTDSPRVGDGFVRIDATGTVTYASTNALSVYRRLGLTTDLTGLDLAGTTRELVPASRRPDEETVSAILGGRAPLDTELGNGETVVIARAVPLVRREDAQPQHLGALVLLRDVTDLRDRDRELVTKDATIREIHHRVKNNLQTVAALLRLQSRRMSVPQARAALDEAVRRVGSIAAVHETLSQSLDETVEFDEIADRLRLMVTEMGAEMGAEVGAEMDSAGSD